jgi:hypothetical protein
MENLKMNTVDYKAINKGIVWACVKKERRHMKSRTKVKMGTRLSLLCHEEGSKNMEGN